RWSPAGRRACRTSATRWAPSTATPAGAARRRCARSRTIRRSRSRGRPTRAPALSSKKYMAAERPPLTPDERAALHDPDVRRRLAGGGRFRLTQRSIASQELAGIDFDGVDLEDVDFVQTRIS